MSIRLSFNKDSLENLLRSVLVVAVLGGCAHRSPVLSYDAGEFRNASGEMIQLKSFVDDHESGCLIGYDYEKVIDVVVKLSPDATMYDVFSAYVDFADLDCTFTKVKLPRDRSVSLLCGDLYEYNARTDSGRCYVVTKRGVYEIDSETACEDCLLDPLIDSLRFFESDALQPIETIANIPDPVGLFCEMDLPFSYLYEVLKKRPTEKMTTFVVFYPRRHQ